MRRTCFQRCVRLVLGAAVLLSSMIPPGVCHAHAEGDRPHRHDHAHHHCDGHGDHAREVSHDNHERAVSESVPHIHINVFGFELTLPSSDREGQKGPHVVTELVLIASNNPAIVRAPAEWLRSVSILSPPLPHVPCPASDESSRLAVFSVDSSIPLCDSARRERSGVLNI